MDAAHINQTRKFPAYTMNEISNLLRDPALVDGNLRDELKAELDRRMSGKSVAFSTPQAKW